MALIVWGALLSFIYINDFCVKFCWGVSFIIERQGHVVKFRAIKELRVCVFWHYAIRTDKPPNICIIVSGIVVIKPRIIQPLAGEEPVRGDGAGAGGAVRVVLHAAHLSAITRGHHRRAGDVVLMDEPPWNLLASFYIQSRRITNFGITLFPHHPYKD